MLKWFAPILVFTQMKFIVLINKEEESIHEHYFVEIPKIGKMILNDKWENYLKLNKKQI